MPRLLLKLSKRTDGGYAFAAHREDGTVTWQRGATAEFFPMHDITHYVVETELSHRRGFLGLLAEGWDFADFDQKWDRSKYPDDAEPSELLAGMIDGELRSGGMGADGALMTAGELNAYCRRFLEDCGVNPDDAAKAVNLSDEQLTRIRARVAELTTQWRAMEVGGTMELAFDVS